MGVRQVVPDIGLDLRKMPDLSDAQTRARLSPAAVTAFLRIVELWDLRNDQAMALLGGMSNGKYHGLKRRNAAILSQDELTRISYLIGIFKSLNILFSAKLANQWVQLENTNPMYKGAAPIQVMVRLGMPALMETRRLLDSRRGGR